MFVRAWVRSPQTARVTTLFFLVPVRVSKQPLGVSVGPWFLRRPGIAQLAERETVDGYN